MWYPVAFDCLQQLLQVCSNLLQSTGQPHSVSLYAAQTLRNKIRKQLQSLPSDSLPGLRDTVTSCMKRQSAETQAVSVQLCIAMSALVLQWTEWQDVLQHLGTFDLHFSILLLSIMLPSFMSHEEYMKRQDLASNAE